MTDRVHDAGERKKGPPILPGALGRLLQRFEQLVHGRPFAASGEREKLLHGLPAARPRGPRLAPRLRRAIRARPPRPLVPIPTSHGALLLARGVLPLVLRPPRRPLTAAAAHRSPAPAPLMPAQCNQHSFFPPLTSSSHKNRRKKFLLSFRSIFSERIFLDRSSVDRSIHRAAKFGDRGDEDSRSAASNPRDCERLARGGQRFAFLHPWFRCSERTRSESTNHRVPCAKDNRNARLA